MPGGDKLITFSNDGVIQQIDPSDRVVWQLDADKTSYGYAEWRTSLYGPPDEIMQ